MDAIVGSAEQAFALDNYGFSWFLVGDRRTLVEDCKDFRNGSPAAECV